MSSVQVTPSHVARQAAIYIRQSNVEQVTHNLESQRRQYGLVDRAVSLGWSRPQVLVIDDDLGVSGGGMARVGFEGLVAEVGLGQIGIVLALEVSRLARNNRDWYHLLDLCALVDTLIADVDGLYHPGVFNDRCRLDAALFVAGRAPPIRIVRLNRSIDRGSAQAGASNVNRARVSSTSFRIGFDAFRTPLAQIEWPEINSETNWLRKHATTGEQTSGS
jgi:Resolvase, N terminal domain